MSYKNDVTVIIAVYKRLYLDEQLQALLGQTVPPAQIWIMQNERHVDINPVVEKYRSLHPHISVIQSDVNLKFFGRFTIAQHVDTEFAWVLDDDVIPGRTWVERCINKCRALNAVIACSGRIIPNNDFVPEKGGAGEWPKYFIGDGYDDAPLNHCPQDTYVDYGCNSYFFKTEWITDFWTVYPSTFKNGDDIHLGASLKMMRNIPTVVLEQRSEEDSGNLKKSYTCDEHSFWLSSTFFETREPVFRNLISERGWKPLLWS